MGDGLFEKHKDFLSSPLLLTMMLLTYEQLAEINLQFENDLEFMLDGDMYIFSSPLKIKLFDKPMAVISG